MNVNGEEFGVGYWPGDSRSGMVRRHASLYMLYLTSPVWWKLQLARTYLVRRQLAPDREVRRSFPRLDLPAMLT